MLMLIRRFRHKNLVRLKIPVLVAGNSWKCPEVSLKPPNGLMLTNVVKKYCGPLSVALQKKAVFSGQGTTAGTCSNVLISRSRLKGRGGLFNI